MASVHSIAEWSLIASIYRLRRTPRSRYRTCRVDRSKSATSWCRGGSQLGDGWRMPSM